MADFKHEISDEIRRAVAQQQARKDVEVEKVRLRLSDGLHCFWLLGHVFLC